MGSRSNAIEEITRFWLQSRHGCLVSESIPVPVPYALSDIDIAAVKSDGVTKIELPVGSDAQPVMVGPRLIVETKDEHDWDSSGNEFAALLQTDLSKMVDKLYIPRGAKGVKFTMLRQEHFEEATSYFGSDGFDRLFVVHAVNPNVLRQNSELLAERRVYFVTVRDVVADLCQWYSDPKLRKAGLRHTLVGDLWHLLVGFCGCVPPLGDE
jgi:hypothetical protein